MEFNYFPDMGGPDYKHPVAAGGRGCLGVEETAQGLGPEGKDQRASGGRHLSSRGNMDFPATSGMDR